jgi:hypothetical protein
MQVALAGGRAAMIQTVFFAAIRVTAFGLLLFLAMLVLDKSVLVPGWVAGILAGISVLGILRTGRLIWFLKKLLVIATRSDSPDASDAD